MEPTKRIGSLDSLRGIAAMSVVIYHCLLCFPVFFHKESSEPYLNFIVKLFNYTPLHVFAAGRESVLLFFVLSGFVLAIPFLTRHKIQYRPYALQRFCRIYIPYIFVMLVSSFLMIILSDYKPLTSLTEAFNHRWDHPLTWQAIFSYIFMLGYDVNNINGATWSLVHEMRISLMFPLLMLIITKFDWKKALFISFTISMFICIMLKGIVTVSSTKGPFMFLLDSLGDTFFYITFFIFGAVLAKCSPSIGSFFKRLKKTQKVCLLIISLTLFNMPLLNLLPFGSNKFVLMFKDLLIQWLIALAIIILFSLVLNTVKLTSILEKPSMLWLGKISYSIYLIHPVIIILAGRYLGSVIPLPLSIFLVPLITIPAAWLMYLYIEVPSIKLGSKIKKKFINNEVSLKVS